MGLEINEVPVSGINGLTSRVPKKQMGKDDFLLLLTKQLQNQDPMKPMDNMEFVAQMAQFTSLEQMTNMNKSIERFVASANQSYKIQAMSMLGWTVTAKLADSPEPITGAVSAVSFQDGVPIFRVGGKDVTMDEIIKVDSGGPA